MNGVDDITPGVSTGNVDGGVTLKQLSNSTDLVVTNGDDADSESSQSESDKLETRQPPSSRRLSAPVGLSTIGGRGSRDRLASRSQASELDNADSAFHRIGSTSSQMSFGSSPPTPLGLSYEHVSEVVPEELSIGYADDIFKKCCAHYLVFVDKTVEFRQNVQEFKNSVSPFISSSQQMTIAENEDVREAANLRSQFSSDSLSDCLQVYVHLLDEEKQKQQQGHHVGDVTDQGLMISLIKFRFVLSMNFCLQF